MISYLILSSSPFGFSYFLFDFEKMSFFDAIPPTIVTLGSFLLLVLNCNIKNDASVASPQMINTYKTDTKNVRFSTIKRDMIKLGICIVQVSLFSFLLGWKIENINRAINKYSLYDEIIHEGLLVFCWVSRRVGRSFIFIVVHNQCLTYFFLHSLKLYTVIIAVIAKKPRGIEWSNTLNAHLVAIFFTAFLCSMWHLRLVFMSIDEIDQVTKYLDKIAAVFNVILSFIATAVAITIPRGPPLFDNGRPVSPISYASILDFITFSTMTPLMKRAYYKDAFNDLDLDQLPFNLRALTVYHDFKVWRSKSLLYRIWKANKRIIIYQIIGTVCSALLWYIPVLFLYNFLEYVQKKPLNRTSDWGYVCLFGMLISNVLLFLSIGQQWYWSASEFNVAVKGMLNAEIYAKSLKMLNGLCFNDDRDENKNNKKNTSENDNLTASVGKITNLMAVDSNRIGQFLMWWTNFIDSPIQISIALYFLYQLLGIASIYAFTIMIIILPLNQLNSRRFSKSQNQLMRVRDNRVGVMNEVLQGIRMIKLFAWEKNWKKRILGKRKSIYTYLKFCFKQEIFLICI
jgi:hypothetical protein